MVGFVAATSLLLRHWGAIEHYTQVMAQPDLTSPLLQVHMLMQLCISGSIFLSAAMPACSCLSGLVGSLGV